MNGEAEDDCPIFELSVNEVGIVYGALYGQNKNTLTPEETLDEMERREIMPGIRHNIPAVLKTGENLLLDMRNFLVDLFGEDKISAMEKQLDTIIEG